MMHLVPPLIIMRNSVSSSVLGCILIERGWLANDEFETSLCS